MATPLTATVRPDRHDVQKRRSQRVKRHLFFQRHGVKVVSGWEKAATEPAEPTVFVKDGEFDVRIVFGTAVAAEDTTSDGVTDTIRVDMTGDGRANVDGVPADTTGDGRVDTVALDTTGDGRVDSHISLTTGDGQARFKTSVRLQADGALQLSFPSDSRQRVTIDHVMEAIEAWGFEAACTQADALAWETAHNFEVTAASIGDLYTLKPTSVMVDETGNGVADDQQVLWFLPGGMGPVVGPVLAQAQDMMHIKVRTSVTHAPRQVPVRVLGDERGRTDSMLRRCVVM